MLVLSSVAERAYWLARYVERAENTARIILVNNNLLLDMPRNVALGWEPIAVITGSGDLFKELYDEASERNVMRFLVNDSRNPNCMLCCLALARENLRTTRAIFPRAVWESLNDLYEYTREHASTAVGRRGRHAFMRQIVDRCQLIAGKLSATMSHDQTYDFVRIGRSIERADMTTRVIDVRANSLLPDHTEELKPFDDIQWKSVLDSLAAYQMYRRYVHVRVRGHEALRYLLLDPYFPRSVSFCFTEIDACLRRLPANDAPLRTLGSAQRLVKEVEVTKIARDGLNDFINELQLTHTEFNNRISATYFEVPDEGAERTAASS